MNPSTKTFKAIWLKRLLTKIRLLHEFSLSLFLNNNSKDIKLDMQNHYSLFLQCDE